MNEKPGFFGQLLGVLYRPREIFSKLNEEDLVKGLLVVALMSLIGAYSTIVYMDKIPLSMLAPQLGDTNIDPEQISGNLGLIAGIGTGVSLLIGWIVSTLVLHGLGMLLGGDGSMRRFFAINGYAAFPRLLNQVLRLVDAFIMESESLKGYFISYNDIQSKLLKAIFEVNVISIWGLASLVLLVVGLEENYKLSTGRSMLLALIPSLLLFILIYYTS
jgi:hypothetical protein